MKLHTTTWGGGERVAVLVHGVLGSAQQFWRVGPALAERGYRVIAVDLPGHGDSPIDHHGNLTSWAAALVETVGPHPALALGHSAGGVLLAAALPALQPTRAVYVDLPLTATTQPPHTADPALESCAGSRLADAAAELAARFTAARDGRTVEALRLSKPRWTERDREVEAAAAERFDVSTAVAVQLAYDNHPVAQPPSARIPSLVIHADPSRYVTAARATELRALGFHVRAIAGADHCVWYSHFDEFMAALDSFVGKNTYSPPTGTSGHAQQPHPTPPKRAVYVSLPTPYRVRMDVELLAAASTEFERVVRGLPEEAWALPTPCEVDVRELVEHVVQGNQFAVAVLAGASATEAWAAVRRQDFNDLSESAAQQIEAFRTATADQVVHHPAGDISAEAFLRYRLVDVVVHAWDLLWTAGQDDTLDPTVSEQLWALVEPHLPEMLAFGSYGDGPSGSVSAEAPAQFRLLDAFGRRLDPEP